MFAAHTIDSYFMNNYKLASHTHSKVGIYSAESIFLWKDEKRAKIGSTFNV